jgi:tape measure domain-containing protein
MAAKGITLPIVFKSDDKGIKDAERAIKGFEGRLGGLEKLLRVGVAGAAVVAGAAIAGVGFAITKGFGRLQDIENAEFKLRGLGNSAETVEEVMKNALQAVKGTAFGLGEAATIAASAVAAGVKPGQELAKFLSLTADAAAIAGVPLNEMGAILNKVTTANRAYTMELTQLADRGIPIFQALAEVAGVSAAEVRDLASEGAIDAAMLAEALENVLGGAAQTMGDSTAGAFANMNASIARTGANLIKDIFPQFGNFFRSMIEVMEPVEAMAARIGQALGAKLNPALERIIDSLPKIVPFLESLNAVFIILTNRFMIVKSAVEPIVEAFSDMQSRLPELRAILDAVLGVVSKLALQGFNLLLAIGYQVATQLLPALIDAFIQVAPSLIELVTVLTDTFLPVIVELAQIAIPILVGILSVVTPIVKFLGAVLAGTGGSLAVLIVGVYGAIKAFQLFRTVMLLAQAIQLGFAAASYGAAGATYAQAGAARVALVAGNLLNGTYLMQAGALLTNTVHLVASRVALIAQAVATNVSAVAVRLFNAALAANPIGLIVGLLAALTAGLIYFLTNTETGRAVVANVMDFFKRSFENVGNTFTFIFGTIMPAVGKSFMDAVSELGDHIVGFGEGFMEVLRIVGAFFRDIVNGYIGIWESFINFFLNGINMIIRGLNRLQVRLPATPFSGPLTIGVNIPTIPNISLPRLAEGGIVKAQPGGILANIGEGRFDEAVIPLDGKNRMGATYVININANVADARLGEVVVNAIKRYERTSGPVFASA